MEPKPTSAAAANEAWEQFRAAIRRLGAIDRQRAELYLRGAAASVDGLSDALERERG